MRPARFAARLDRTATETTRDQATQPAPLTVGAADDRAEHEADRVADEVIARLQGGPAHSHPTGHGHGGVRRSATTPAGAEVGYEGGALSADLSSRIESKRGGGSALPGGVRRRLEQGFGGSLSDVRIHTDTESASLNRAVAARAFTAGKDIFFGAGEYRPETPEGERVLAHEVAHARQGGGDARRTPIRRLWDLNQPKLDWARATGMRTFEERFVWFIKDQDGDEIVVKLDDQPVGLGQLVGALHETLGSGKSVVQKKLEYRDRAWIAGMLQDPQVAAGDSWGKLAKQKDGQGPPGMEPLTDENAEESGRKISLHQLRTSRADLVAMNVAAGKSAGKLAEPHHGGTGYDPDVSFFRMKLEQPAHAKQLGRIAAIDLFMGNNDRVTAGNMGNWFYDPGGAVTMIDHVDSGQWMARSFVADSQTWEQLSAPKLANDMLFQTMYGALNEIGAEAREMSKDLGFGDWLRDDVGGGKTRRQVIAEHMAEGMREEKKRLVKVFTSTRFTWGGSKARAQKKALKKVAKKAQQDDQGHEKFQGAEADYYAIMKARAAWLKRN